MARARRQSRAVGQTPERRDRCVVTTTPVAVFATAGAAALAPSGLGGCLASLCSHPALSFLDPTPSSDTESTAGASGNGGLDGLSSAHQGDPEEQELYDFLCGGLGRTARQECRRRTEVSVSRDGRSSPGSAWEAPPSRPERPCPPCASVTYPDPGLRTPSAGWRARRLRGFGSGAARVSFLRPG